MKMQNGGSLSLITRHIFYPSSRVRYFNRDVECIRTFFRRRFQYESALYPSFKSTFVDSQEMENDGFRLDVVVAASGFAKKEMKVLEDVRLSLSFQDSLLTLWVVHGCFEVGG